MKTRLALDRMGKQILNQSRTELLLAMRFMARPLNSLSYEMDLRTQRVGTDGERIRFNPEFLLHLFIESPQKLNRLYLHLLLHCLFRHLYSGDGREAALWNLACDIHAESVLDSMDYALIHRPPGAFRQQSYETLTARCRVLTAERLYRHFLSAPPEAAELYALQQEFTKDDHQFWVLPGEQGEQELPEGAASPQDSAGGVDEEDKSRDAPQQEGRDGGGGDVTEEPGEEEKGKEGEGGEAARARTRRREREEQWREDGERLKSELRTLGPEAGTELGSLQWQLELQYKRYPDFRDFLKYLMVEREELRIDPDSFDYAYYYYGMTIYGNMPLIEENEYRDARKIEKLVLAIDTSASCKDILVQKFLNQAAGILSDRDGFFRRVEVHILECDDRIRQDIVLHDVAELEHYSRGFSLRGGYGTDFRPVFSEVERRMRDGGLSGLRGLLYFTDGYGSYPQRPTPYRTAFVFPKDEDYSDEDAPDWALRLYL